MLRILAVHNRYQQPGGEDGVFEDETALLEAHGHEVTRFELHNDAVDGMGTLELAARTVWNAESYRTLAELARRQQADVVHFHNTLPLVSPAGYYAARRAGAAVVQTLHNYRLVCPGALLYRAGRACETCVGRAVAWEGVRRACYRDSRAASAAVAGMTALHRAAGTWRRAVDRYIALTPMARDLFVRGGLPADRIAVKPNFLGEPLAQGSGGGGAFYVGRLASGKGIRTLIEAWRSVPDVPLTVIGDGPLAADVAEAARTLPNVTWLGSIPRPDVLAALRAADLLVFPTEWYEGFPLVLVEAFAAGVPVLTTDHGAAGSIVREAGAGPLVPPGAPEALAVAVRGAFADPARLAAWGRAAREAFEARYTAEANYHQLVAIYAEAVAQRHGTTAASGGAIDVARPAPPVSPVNA